jgi:hypothetical protein
MHRFTTAAATAFMLALSLLSLIHPASAQDKVVRIGYQKSSTLLRVRLRIILMADAS